MSKEVQMISKEVQTKYYCPRYNPRGGHCMATSYQTKDSVHRFGCKYAKDISKCPYIPKKMF